MTKKKNSLYHFLKFSYNFLFETNKKKDIEKFKDSLMFLRTIIEEISMIKKQKQKK